MRAPVTVQESPIRRLARAQFGFRFLGIKPTPGLLWLISHPYRKADRPTGETMEAVVGRLLSQDAYLGPYLIYDADAE